MLNLNNKKISILGAGKSGQAAAYKAKELGAEILISDFVSEDKIDKFEEIKKHFDFEFGGHTEKVLDSDLIIVSPGIPLTIPILKKAEDRNIEIIGEIEFGFRIKSSDSKIIAVTGSNGKSTTVSLLHYILERCKYNTILAGNIGTAFTSFPIEKKGIDYIILELSSFQLDLIRDFKPNIAVILNITPDHLNRYSSFEDYAKSKFKIFMNQDENDLSIINQDCKVSTELSESYKRKNVLFSNFTRFSLSMKAETYNFADDIISVNNKLVNISGRQIFGPHNKANIMVAYTILDYLNIDLEKSTKYLNNFSPLQHRMETVDEINGVIFVNDTKATNTDSVKYALNSFDNPIHLIIGGSGKGEDYSKLNRYIKNSCEKLYLIGASSDEMFEVFRNIKIPIEKHSIFESSIRSAFANARRGEIVLLSPACASYDMFTNFEDRGNQFKQIVRKIKNEK